jgi:hypothetical protein
MKKPVIDTRGASLSKQFGKERRVWLEQHDIGVAIIWTVMFFGTIGDGAPAQRLST